MKCTMISENLSCLQICEDSTADDLQPLAEALHNLLNIPVTIRSLNNNGLRIESGEVKDKDYTGPVLEEVLKTNKIIRTVPTSGCYKGKAVAVVPICTLAGKIIGALGVVDLVAALDILSVFKEYPDIFEEVEKSRNK